jgi:16S rRNA (guanine527-N7)-methyltransferase
MADETLFEVLDSLRERGAHGESSLVNAVGHAEAFLAAFPLDVRRVIDLGSGGGLPGLVLAVRRPSVVFTLVDRRERRMDLLRLAVFRLGLADRVEVLTDDVVRLATDKGYAAGFDVVTARAFGPPMLTASCARPFLRTGGAVIVSEPPASSAGDRWDDDALAGLGLTRSVQSFPQVQRLELLRS